MPTIFRAFAVVRSDVDGVILFGGGFDVRSIRGGRSGAFAPISNVESRLFASIALSCVATASVVSSSDPLKLNLLSMVDRRKL